MNLDPSTLATRGMETLGGLLSPGLPMELGSADINASFGKFQQLLGANAGLSAGLIAGGGQACTAHPHVDSNTGRLALFTYKMQAQVCGCDTVCDTVCDNALFMQRRDPSASLAARVGCCCMRLGDVLLRWLQAGVCPRVCAHADTV